ncbi:hypothetical protein CAPTEDRAFT_146164, partial [Capitella teleta]
FVGNRKLHTLTTKQRYELRFDMFSRDNGNVIATYATFSIGSEDDKFRLDIGGYVGNFDNSMSYHDGRKFSTPDNDNDGSFSLNCAEDNSSGWWFANCILTDLNSPYDDIIWKLSNDYKIELQFTEMKMRPG